MNSTESLRLPPTLASRAAAVLRALIRGIAHVFAAMLLVWAALAIHYSNVPGAWLRLILAVAFAAFGIWALWISRKPRMRLVFAGLFLAVCAWWATILPSHDRDWRRDVAVMPHAVVDGDRAASREFAISTTGAGPISRRATWSAKCRSRI